MNDVARTGSLDPFVLSDGEVDFLWWFIQGSIMDPDVRARLYAHWGMCARHSLAFFAVEAAFRPHLIHGCAIVYGELLLRGANALSDRGLHSLVPDSVLRHLLHVSGPCHMCALGYHDRSEGNAPPDRVAQGRDMGNARRFAEDNRGGWLPHVCGRCAGRDFPALCRPHLLEAMEHGDSHVARTQYARLDMLHTHLANFENSFRWDRRDSDTEEDRGALIAAIGWCAGWSELLRTLVTVE